MKKLLILGIGVLVVFLGCGFMARDFYLGPEDFPDEFKGGIVLVMDSSAIPTKTIVPSGITMEAGSFDILLDFQPEEGEDDVPDVNVTNFNLAVYSNYGLTAGKWNLSITAYDIWDPDLSDGDDRTVTGALDGDVGATREVEILAGTLVVFGDDEVLPVIPLIGTGDLSLDLVWPADAADSPGVLAHLVKDEEILTYQAASDKSGWLLQDNTGGGFVISTTTPGFAQFAPENNDATKDTGYWALFISLRDSGTQVLGIVESVRIIKDYETWGEVDLSVQAGTLQLVIDDVNLQNPVGITFQHNDSTGTPTIAAGETVTVTATFTYPDPLSGTYDYNWYVDGIPTTKTQFNSTYTGSAPPATLTYDLTTADGAAGNHHLTLMITGSTDGTVETLSSASLGFAVE